MTITAKYAATCPTCCSAITPGQQIEWSKGSKAVHTSCAGTASGGSRRTSISISRKPREGKWTGCSCGSREDSNGMLIPSARNCKSCRFDAE